MRTILVLLFVLTGAAVDEATLTPEQKLAALVFTDVQAIDVTTFVLVEMPSDRSDGRSAITAAAVHPSRAIAKDPGEKLLAMIASAANYRFDDSARCFDPGFRIRVHERQRIVTLSICLKCFKMAVSTAPGKAFYIDFSPAGLLAYKTAYHELIVLKQGLEHE